jgi:hypothetical protein
MAGDRPIPAAGTYMGSLNALQFGFPRRHSDEEVAMRANRKNGAIVLHLVRKFQGLLKGDGHFGVPDVNCKGRLSLAIVAPA